MVTNRLILSAVLLLPLSACQSTGTVGSGLQETPARPQTSRVDAAENPQRQAGTERRQRNSSETGRQYFIEEHDLDGDGRVSLTEFIKFRHNRFAGGDVDGDGLLDQTEYVDEYAVRLDRQLERERQAHDEQTRARFKALDSNGDGSISREEFEASGERIFARLDPDGTGRVVADSGEPAEPRSRGRSMLSMPTTHRISGFMELYDDAASGVVTRAAFQRQREAQFAATNAGGNGRISFDEYLTEFMVRVDRRAEQVRSAQLRQAGVRFGAMDRNDDGMIDPDEYLTVGLRSFRHWDTRDTGVVSAGDPLPDRELVHARRSRGDSGSPDRERGQSVSRAL